MNKADANEMTFVLLARDIAAPVTIRAWVEERIRLGKNHRDDAQIVEALHCSAVMEQQCNGGRGLILPTDDDRHD